MSRHLTQLGWSAYSLNLAPNWGNASLEELAQQVADYTDANFEPKQPLDLVGLSMGGLVARYYLQRLGGINRVQRFIRNLGLKPRPYRTALQNLKRNYAHLTI